MESNPDSSERCGHFFLALSEGHRNREGNSHSFFFFLVNSLSYNVGNLKINIYNPPKSFKWVI